MHIADNQLLLFPPIRPLAERFGADFFRAVPERPGVYLMSAARDGVLYVGKAKNLRRRLGSYRSASSGRLTRKLTRLLLRVERIDWDECADEAAAVARERELIRALQPRFNTMGLHAPKQWFIGWQRRGNSVRLALAEDLDSWPAVHGPFVSARPAFAALLRTCWLELHPGASVAALPSRLSTWSPPTRWDIPWTDAIEKWLAELDAFLCGGESRLISSLPAEPHEEAQHRAGVSLATRQRRSLPGRLHDQGRRDARPTLKPPALPSSETGIHSQLISASTEVDPPPPLSFDEQWRAMDAECLTDFHDRIAATRLLLS
jgi:predicted GIY-YIG superfamily endonuclease